MSKIGRKIAAWFLVAAVIICYGLAFVMWRNALVEWWIPSVICIVSALVSGVMIHRHWSVLTGSDSRLLNYICHVVAAVGLFAVLFFAINSFFADRSSLHTERVGVSAKYTEEGYHTRRVGRHYTRRGEKYTNYYIELVFADGRTKRVSVDNRRYNRTRNGDSLSVELEQGALGIPVIRDIHR